MISYIEPYRRYCEPINDFVFEQIKRLQHDIVILASRWEGEISKFDYTIAKLKEAKINRIVVLGPLPRWGARGLPNNIIDYYYEYMPHRLMPQRTHFRSYGAELDAEIHQKAVAAGAEYISAWEVLCNAEGCLTRIGDNKSDITAHDYAHLTVAGSIFLVNAIKSRLLRNFLPYDSTKQQ